MAIKFYAPLWGNTLSFDNFCQNVKDVGYDGVELALPFEMNEKQEIIETLHNNKLELIGQYWQFFEKNLDEHAENYERYLRNLIQPNLFL